MEEVKFEEFSQQFIDVISKRYNLQGLNFEEGVCILSFDEANVVTLYPQYDHFHAIVMHVLVGAVPLDEPNIKDLYVEMLNGNDAWSMTQGATIGMDSRTGMISLWDRFTLPVDSEDEVIDTLETLLAAAEHWRGFIEAYGGKPAFGGGSSAVSDASPQSPMMMA